MSDSNHPIPDDELISAYHDGELRGEDLARAERLLAEQPEARQLLEDLRVLSSTLGSTPRQSLGDDFSQRVLRQAEREMLEAAPVKSPAASARSKPTRLSKVKVPALTKSRAAPLPRWPQGSRPWIYVAIATAAAIVLMLNRPDDGPNVAVMGDNAARDLNEVGEIAAAPVGRPGLPPLLRKGEGGDNDFYDGMRRENDTAPRPTVPPVGGERFLGKTGEGPLPKGGFGGTEGMTDRAKVAQYNEDGRQAVLRSITSLGLDVSPKEVESQVRQTEQTLDDLPIEAGVVVIYCDVNRNAWNQNGLVTVERSFNDNGIATEQEALADATRFKQQEGLTMANNMAGGAGGNRMIIADPVETFYVVATSPQLAATLDKLESCKDVVVNLNVQAVPDTAGASIADAEAKNEPPLSSYSRRGLEPARWALQQQTQQHEMRSRSTPSPSQKPRDEVELKASPAAEPQHPAAPAPAEPEARDMRRNSGVAGGGASSAKPPREDSTTDADKRSQGKILDSKKLDQETPADSQVPVGGKANLAEKDNAMQRQAGGIGGGALAPAKPAAPVSGPAALDGAVGRGTFDQGTVGQTAAPAFGRAQRLVMQQNQAELPQVRGEQAAPASPANAPQAAATPAPSQPATSQPPAPQSSPAPAAESAPRQSMAKGGYATKPEPKPGDAPASAKNPAPALTTPAPVAAPAPVTVKQLDDANLQQLTAQPTSQSGSSYGNDANVTKLQRAILIFRCVEPATADSKVPTAPID